MTVLIRKTNWHGLDALALENEYLCTVTVPELGAKVVSLFDKRNQKEWLVGPGSRPVKKVTYGAWFHEQDLSGWDEMFPTIIACPYPGPGEQQGAPLPDHGEVWSLPWDIERAEEGKLTLRVQGRTLPYQLIRTLVYTTVSALLEFQYQLTNLGHVRMPYIWAAHPQFVCGLGDEIILPSHVTEVCNTIPAPWGWGEPETRFHWPLAIGVDGQPVRINRIGPSSLHKARKFFLMPDMRAEWTGIRTPVGDWICLDWNPALVPYFGLWVDEGAISHESVVALEPTTGFYDSLAVACEKNEVNVLEPGIVQTWTLRVRLGTNHEPFPHDE